MHSSNNSLYKSHFVNMMPQRGFLTSAQNLITAIDIDLDYDTEFYATIFTDDNKPFVFIKNGPLKICPYQKTFKIICENEETFKYFSDCKFYKPEGNYKTKDGIWSFADADFYFSDVPFEKKVENNTITFSILPESINAMLRSNALICSPPTQVLDPYYGFKVYMSLNQSCIMYYSEGYEKILKFVDDKFKELNLSGHLYKTKNGLRILLTDKFRDISEDANVSSIVSIMEEFMMDRGFVNAYKLTENRLKEYLVRLTPKLKNYEKLDISYKKILKDLESTNLSSLYLEKNVVPLKYNFDKIFYANDSTSETIDSAFEVLKKLILKYLNHSDYAVCKFIKKYNYAEESTDILNYVAYHDKWTKAHADSKFLI